MNLLPVRQVRIDAAAGGTFSSSALQSFGYQRFEPGTYTVSQLTYTHQSGHQIPYASRAELVVDLVDFTASEYAALRLFTSVDIEITLGLPGETATVVTFLASRIALNYNVTEGVQKLKVSALQISTAAGVVLPVSQADFGYGQANPSENRFSLDIVESRVGMELLKLPYRNGEYTDVERTLGYKRFAEITIAPTALQGTRQGFGSQMETWLLAEEKFVRMYNFFGETGGYDSYREVILVQTDLQEERIDNLFLGRNMVITIKDKYKQSVS